MDLCRLSGAWPDQALQDGGARDIDYVILIEVGGMAGGEAGGGLHEPEIGGVDHSVIAGYVTEAGGLR